MHGKELINSIIDNKDSDIQVNEHKKDRNN